MADCAKLEYWLKDQQKAAKEYRDEAQKYQSEYPCISALFNKLATDEQSHADAIQAMIGQVCSTGKENPCLERSFEAVDPQGNIMRAVVVTDDGVRRFSVCHSKDGKDHTCYISSDRCDEQYDTVKRMFEAWGYKFNEVVGNSCL